MSQVGKLAPYLDGIKVVASSAERDALFPSPDTRQRVQNLGTGFFERWDGANWVQDTPVNVGGTVINVRSLGAAGNGVADDTAVIAAANAAAVAGTIVYFPAGTYLNSTAITAVSGVSYRGDGYGSYIKMTTDTPAFSGSGKSNVEISGLRIDGQQTGSGTGSWSLINFDFSPTNVVIRNNWLLNGRTNAINLHQPFDCVIQGNYIAGCAGHGVWLRTSNGTQPKNNKILGNTVVNAGTNPVANQGDGILVDTNNDVFLYVVCANNIVRNSFRIGIEFQGTQGCQYISVTGNVVEHVSATGAQYGISIAGCKFGAITGNTIRGGVIGLEGASASDTAFVGNTVDGSSSIGISISGTCTDVAVSSNVVANTTDHGIEINGTSGVTRASVTGNVVRASATRGIFLNSLGQNSDFTVNSNTVTGCGKSGVFIFESDRGTIVGNTVTGNNTGSNGGEGIGIYISLSAPRDVNTIVATANRGQTYSTTNPTGTVNEVGLMLSGGFKKYTAAVTNASTGFAHGLPYIPSKILFFAKGNVTVWQSASADATNIFLQASAAGPTNVDVYVA